MPRKHPHRPGWAEEILAMEERLLALGDDCDIACLDALLADDFVELGASGKVWTRPAMLAELAEAGARSYHLDVIDCRKLAPEVVLLVYCVQVEGRASLRSSIWTGSNGRWRLTFHQGTRLPNEA